MAEAITTCQAGETTKAGACGKPARCAISTTRPTRANLKSTIYYDDREAPAKATRYCHEHGVETVTALAKAMIDGDE